MTEAVANGYSVKSTQRELSNEYQHDKVFKNLCILVLCTKAASALEGLIVPLEVVSWYYVLLIKTWLLRIILKKN